jgi:hypothetical protein
MQFSTWLWDQMDIPGPLGRFAKLCWDDVNNGCALPTFNAKTWLNHFETKHPESRGILSTALIKSYKEYIISTEHK